MSSDNSAGPCGGGGGVKYIVPRMNDERTDVQGSFYSFFFFTASKSERMAR